MDESRHERVGGCVTKLNCEAVVGLRQKTPSKLRVLCNGKTLAFQANDTSSILVTRSNCTPVAMLHHSSHREGEQCRLSER